MLTLSIRGLCLVVKREKGYEVLLHAGNGHTPVLTAVTSYLKPFQKEQDRWEPDFIGHIPVVTENSVKFEQVAMWQLGGKVVQFGTGEPGEWKQLASAIGFGKYHPRATTESPKGAGVLRISEGTPHSCEPVKLDIFRHKKHLGQRPCAREVRWTDLSLEICAGEKSIRFKNPAIAAITNGAPEADPDKALTHFRHYYDMLRDENSQKIGEPARISIARVRKRTDEVFDCVPPGSVP